MTPSPRAYKCICAPSWPGMTVTVGGRTREAVRATEGTDATSEAIPTCVQCGAGWNGDWTFAETVERKAVDMLHSLIAKRPGGEVRPQQERMVTAVEHAIATNSHLVAQAGTGTGKALDVSVEIPTTGGWVKMGDLVVGDIVFSEQGETTNVVGAYDTMYDHDCFNITFSDGATIVADAGHLWSTVSNRGSLAGGKGKICLTSTTAEMSKSLMVTGGISNHAIAVTRSVQYPHCNLPVNPYTLGAWLAHDLASSSVSTVTPRNNASIVNPETLRALKVWDSGHIPTKYLTASETQRREMLAGLLDGGAYAKNIHGVHMCSVNQRLINDVAELAASLGYQPIVTRDVPTEDNWEPTWSVRFEKAEQAHGRGGEVSAHNVANEDDMNYHADYRYVLSVDRVPTRPVRCIAVDSPSRLFLAGRSYIPTHNTLAYLIPAIMAGKRVVVATATKQLSEQIVNEDLPDLAIAIPNGGGPKFTYSILKGRQNFLCKAKLDELLTLDSGAPGDREITEALFSVESRATPRRPTSQDLAALNRLIKWAETTQTGDRSEAPAASEAVWSQVSTDSAGCPGAKECPFGGDCFSEAVRRTARTSSVVVTNHAVVAHDLLTGNSALGEYSVLITDEVHELENFLSSAWGSEVAPTAMKHAVALASRRLPRDEQSAAMRDVAAGILADLDALNEMLIDEEPGLKAELSESITLLLVNIANKTQTVSQALDRSAKAEPIDGASAGRLTAAQKIMDIGNKVITVARAGEGTVRWLESGRVSRTPILKTSPLWVGDRLMNLLGERTLIATSATITVGGTFESMVRTLGLELPLINGEDTRPFTTVDVGTPFNWDTQAMLYIPDNTFPEPTYQNRDAHKQAVLEELVALITAAGGRTLALFTTMKAAKDATLYLRERLATPVLGQGDAPPLQLITEFTADEATTLCATLGFWHGVNAPGPTLSLVVMDKIPFAPQDDPLMAARRSAAEKAGRPGFTEIFVAGAAVKFAQGSGRLIRTGTDKGVIAILDRRILSKPSYGNILLGSISPIRIFRDRMIVEGALKRLTGGTTTNSVSESPTGRIVNAKPKAAPKRKAAPRKSATRNLGRVVKGKPKSDPPKERVEE